jgi:HK97 family phage prohead protease
MTPTTIQAALHGIAITAAAEDGTPTREITALAAPYGVTTVDSMGTPFMLEAGALPLDGPAPKVYLYHDSTQAIGVVSERLASKDGVIAAMKISQTALGNEALTLAADGVLDAVSVGLEVIDGTYNDHGVLVVTAAKWRELSLVPYGAFPEAKVLSVAASQQTASTPEEAPEQSEEDQPMSNEAPALEATVPTAPIVIAAAPKKVTAAEYLSAAVTGNQAILEAANNGSSDVPGILPEPLVGDVFDTLNDRRPFVSSIGTLAAPNAEVWYRRKVSQHTAVDFQANEFDNFASQALQIDKLTVNNGFMGGYVDLSEQVIDWSDPSMVNLTLRDMTRIYAKQTETAACASLVSGVTEELGIVDWADGDELLDALYDCAATIDGVIDELPTHVFLSADRWANFGKAKAGNGERILPAVGPMNAAGTMTPGSFSINGLGLRFVVSSKFAAGTCVVGNPMGIELYERQKGSIRVDQPANASVRLAVRGYWASLVIEPGAFVKLVND